MIRPIAFVILSSALALSGAFADDLTRNAQTELKNQGFYYGEINGSSSSDTSAAIRRFQIRNGLDITGTLNSQTLQALGLAKAAAVSPVPAPAAPSAPPRQEMAPRHDLRSDEPAMAETPPIVPPPVPMRRPFQEPPPVGALSTYSVLFERTPFENAPVDVQRGTVRNAQSFLARQGFYRAALDGLPSVDLEEALLIFQRRAHQRLSGRLDMETLDVMHLLPGRGGPPTQVGESPAKKTYRGVWVR